ncbi:MAG: hypothetical protein H6719_34150 [Sandaracinaceae bacterium]|nr:hypothetical protein [Sandaracinaceae bacterium]
MGGAARRAPIVVVILALACAEPPSDVDPEPPVDEVVAPPAVDEPPPDEPEPDEPEPPDPLAGLTDDVTSGLGSPRRLDDRTGARVRNAIRARIGTRPTLITSRHYVRDDGSTVSVSTFVGSYIERCVTAGTPREECLIGQGLGALATEQSECNFGGVARVDIGPPRRERDGDEREGDVRATLVEPIGLGEICAFEVESLALRDEDRDGEPEIILGYAWSDLRRTETDPAVVDEGSVRLILDGQLHEQARLTVRFYHHPTEGDGGDRNLVSQLRFVPRAGRRDIALDVIDWLSNECPESDPPRGRGEVCDLQQRTALYRYAPDEDRWIAPEDAP